MSCSNITVSAPNQINITVSPVDTNVTASTSNINVNANSQNPINVNGSFSNDSANVLVQSGPKGDKGDRGIDGVSGSQGPSGLSAGVNYINSLSGQLLLTGTGIIYISSANNNTLIVSGDVSSLYSNSNPANFSNSGNLYSTGSTLSNKIDSLSGYSNNTFSQVKITGSNTFLTPNFTGVGQVVVSSVGNTVYISFSDWFIRFINS
jgi:hypothetical protein